MQYRKKDMVTNMFAKHLKRIIEAGLIIVAGILCSCSDGGGTAEPKAEKQLFIYEIDDGKVTITGYSGVEEKIIIPANIEGYPVMTVSSGAFYDFIDLREVVIPDTVTNINGAFRDCTSLEKANIGSGVIYARSAFEGCSSLTEVEGGENIKYLERTFSGCPIRSAVIPESCIDCSGAFKDCKKLKTVSVNGGMEKMTSTFEGCTGLTEITVPPSVTSLDGTFRGCELLTEVHGGENVSSYVNTFDQCVSLREATLGKSVSEMRGVFTECIALEKIGRLPDKVEYYTPSFVNCRRLTSAVIPEITDDTCRGEYIISDDISGCRSLKTLEVNTVFDVKAEFCKIFSGCISLETLTLPDSMLPLLLRVTYTYTDQLAKAGSVPGMKEILEKAKNDETVRVTDDYGVIDGVPYTHIYGTDIGLFDADEKIKEYSAEGFEPFSEKMYWCGYPKGKNRLNDTAVICRTCNFCLRTTGTQDGNLPLTLSINGKQCIVGSE